jgi:hypothetical protein
VRHPRGTINGQALGTPKSSPHLYRYQAVAEYRGWAFPSVPRHEAITTSLLMTFFRGILRIRTVALFEYIGDIEFFNAYH